MKGTRKMSVKQTTLYSSDWSDEKNAIAKKEYEEEIKNMKPPKELTLSLIEELKKAYSHAMKREGTNKVSLRQACISAEEMGLEEILQAALTLDGMGALSWASQDLGEEQDADEKNPGITPFDAYYLFKKEE